MSHMPVSNSEETTRLFKSDFLEFFSHISPVTITIIWLPVALYFLIRAVLDAVAGAPIWIIPAGLLIGLLGWSFAEYNLHRYMFHYPPKGATQERIVYLFHGVHHAYPQDKTRLVMPPVVAIPLALIFFLLFQLVIVRLLNVPLWFAPVFAGFIFGYLAYDLTHYATHHFPMRSGYFKFIKRYHMQHHYKTPEKRFGVSSPLWDFVYNTYPKD